MSSPNEGTPVIPAEWRVRRKDSVATSDLGDEVVVMHLDEGRYFGLEDVGALVWQLLDEGATVAEIEEAILDEYRVPEDRCRRDLQQLLTELSSRGLISVEAP